ncbi:MAG: hypothetical protein AMXMBFR7_25370 [Planctomycetota bacterium]
MRAWVATLLSLALWCQASSAGAEETLTIQAAPQESPADRTAQTPLNLEAHLKVLAEAKTPSERMAALQTLESISSKPVPVAISEALFKRILFDSDEGVRKTAARAMDTLDDTRAMQFLYKAVIHPAVKAEHRLRAAEGIRWLDRPEVIEALVQIVSYELRVGSATEVQPPQTLFISNGLDVNNPLGNINLPIELPNLELRSVQTSVAVLAFAGLRTISQRDLGAEPAAWQRWFDDFKHIRNVRRAEAAKR